VYILHILIEFRWFHSARYVIFKNSSIHYYTPTNAILFLQIFKSAKWHNKKFNADRIRVSWFRLFFTPGYVWCWYFYIFSKNISEDITRAHKRREPRRTCVVYTYITYPNSISAQFVYVVSRAARLILFRKSIDDVQWLRRNSFPSSTGPLLLLLHETHKIIDSTPFLFVLYTHTYTHTHIYIIYIYIRITRVGTLAVSRRTIYT